VDIEDQKRAELRLAANLEQQAHTADVLRRVLLGESRLDPIPENAAPDAASAPSLVIAPGLRVQADLEPAGGETEPAISGDFYDAFPLQDGQVALLVGDVSGKGATAACRTAEIRHALRAYLHLSGSSSEAGGVTNPARAVGWLNDFLCAQRQTDTRPDQRITALVLIVLDPATGRLVCVAAGSEPPLIVRAAAGPNGQPGPVEVMDEAGLILGVAAR
jgi:serine phosphatase RsbU (regulator of sigma subunit)